MPLTTLIFGTALTVTGTTAAIAETWSIADVEGLERLQVEWTPLKTALDAATGETFDFFPVSSRPASAEALRGETIDFVITGPAEYNAINTLTKTTPLARLQADGIGQLPELWKLASTNPAAALGLAHRGEIAVSYHADLVLLDWPKGGTPAVRWCFVRGLAAFGAIAAG